MKNKSKEKKVGKVKKVIGKFLKRGAIIIGYVLALNIVQTITSFCSR